MDVSFLLQIELMTLQIPDVQSGHWHRISDLFMSQEGRVVM